MNGLLTSSTIKNIEIRNRVVMPPMVCFGWSDESGVVTEKHIAHYAKRAEARTGIIIVEATCVSADAKLDSRQLGIWNDSQIAGLSELSAAIKVNGSVAMIQLHHAGYPGNGVTALAREDLARIRRDFLDGLIRAKKAGFDGIELHGAHGYLISQILSPLRNHREDEYGGSLDNRFRFVEELLEEIRAFDNSRFIIGYRMGGNEPGIEEGIRIAKKLRTAGIDLLHVSLGIEDTASPVVVPKDFDFSKIVYIGSRIKESVEGLPVIVVGGVKTAGQAERIIHEGFGDFVAVGRGMLSDPYWTRKAYAPEMGLIRCLGCGRCGWFDIGDNCPVRK